MGNSHPIPGKLRCAAVLLAAAACLFAWAAGSAAESPASNALPRTAKARAANAPAGFHLKPGFRLELVAAEPAVIAPVAMAFDENGRLFVVERPENPGGTGTNTPAGRIRLLEDPDGEGEYHSSTLFADNLPLASAIACYGGGVFAVVGPDILFLKDSKKKGIADVRSVIFSGFGSTNPATASALPNNFNWGLDNRIHAASGAGAGSVPASGAPGAGQVPLSSADFSFDPRALTIHAETGPAESGLCFEDWGRKFTCDFMRPLRMPTLELRYLMRNPFFPPPPLMVDVASTATAIYRADAVKPPSAGPARPQATNETASLLAQGTNAPPATWLTDAQGCVVYRGGAFPSDYLGNVFVAAPSAHLIHRFVLRDAELGVTAARAMNESDSEFLASEDTGFRPVQIVNGPEGVLYVVDRRDADDRGRIYRIVPANFKRPKPPQLGKAKTSELVAAFTHPSGWERDTAARLLYERRDPKAVPLLSNLVVSSRSPLARAHALHALDGLGALNLLHVAAGLRDADGRVRKHAVLLAEKLAQGGALPDFVWRQLGLMSADPSLRVRYQLAFTVGELHRPDSALVLKALLMRDPNNLWIQAAVFSSLANGAGDLFLALGDDARVRNDPIGLEWIYRLVTMIGVKGLPSEVAQVFGYVEMLQSEPQPAFTLLYTLGEGLHRAHSSLALADRGSRMQPFYAAAAAAVQNYGLIEPWRVAALRLLGVSPYTYASIGDLLLLQIGSGQPVPIQAAALEALGHFDDPRIAPAVAQRYRSLPASLRNGALAVLLSHTNRVAAVVAGLESGTFSGVDLFPAQVNYLRTFHDPAISERARRLFGPVPVQRPQAMLLYRTALNLQGAPTRGREIFAARCAVCHQPSGPVLSIGPDLTYARVFGADKVLTAIIEPNLGARFDYLTYVVETADGESMMGILRDQNPASITLQGVNGAQVVLPRANISYLQPQSWSLMPEGMEAVLTPQGMADLLAYLLNPSP